MLPIRNISDGNEHSRVEILAGLITMVTESFRDAADSWRCCMGLSACQASCIILMNKNVGNCRIR